MSELHRRIYHPRGLEVDVVYGCNAKCPQCSHGSQFHQGYLSVREFIEWCEPWSKRIQPFCFLVIGGEPLLHPQCPEVIAEAKRIWHDAKKIGLWTNGTLPHRITPELLDALKGVEITISVKPYKEIIGQDYTDRIKESIRIYRDHKLNVQIRNYALKKWIDEPWVSPNSSPEAAFVNCWARKCVQPIYKGMLYRCVTIEILQKMHEIGKIDWDGIMDYQPLTPDCSDDEIKALIEHQKHCEYCRFCRLEYPVFCGDAEGFPAADSVIEQEI